MSPATSSLRPGTAGPTQLLGLCILLGLAAAFWTLEAHHHTYASTRPGVTTFTGHHHGIATWPGWRQLYAIAYVLYLLPLWFLRAGTAPHVFRRTLVGLALQLTIGLASPPRWLPCLRVSSVTFLALLAGRLVRVRSTRARSGSPPGTR